MKNMRLQMQCAAFEKLDYIVTANKKDFLVAEIPVYSAVEFVEYYNSQED